MPARRLDCALTRPRTSATLYHGERENTFYPSLPEALQGEGLGGEGFGNGMEFARAGLGPFGLEPSRAKPRPLLRCAQDRLSVAAATEGRVQERVSQWPCRYVTLLPLTVPLRLRSGQAY